MDKETKLSQLEEALAEIKERIYTKVADLNAEYYPTKEPVSYSQLEGNRFLPIAVEEKWGGLFDCAWFKFYGVVPKNCRGKHIVLLIDLNGEGCVFSQDGVPLRGITNVNSEFDRTYGLPGKRVLEFSQKAVGGEKVNILIDGACNDLFGKFSGGFLRQAEIHTCNDDMRTLYYDFWVGVELAKAIINNDSDCQKIINGLEIAVQTLQNSSYNDIDKASVIVKELLETNRNERRLVFTAIGHAHMDLAWLWPIRETKRKAERTFATMLELMDVYPEYIAGVSQPQQFQWIKDRHPALFEKIKKKVIEKQLELQGTMWLEPDINLTGGESLIRQIIYGKEFFMNEFGIEPSVCHLPDVFGFSAALPQILKKTGTEYVLTIKLSWNKYNKFPYHTFNWVGIDGSEVLMHMPPEGTYNSTLSPAGIAKTEQNYAEKEICNEAVILYGIGDGGGGPGKEHIERLKRVGNLKGLAKVKPGFISDFFSAIVKKRGCYPTYRGELYLEKHQGTYTTQAENKRLNRKIEYKLRETEIALTAAWVKYGLDYPAEKLAEIWKEVLLYQFHDILPGSSIKRVYDESVARYQTLMEALDCIAENAAASAPKILVNTLSHEREEIIFQDNEFKLAKFKAFSCESQLHTIDNLEIKTSRCGIENRYLKAEFNADGGLISLIDKSRGEETLTAETNILSVLDDSGDAWDMSDNYLNGMNGRFKQVSCEYKIDGHRAVAIQQLEYGNSKIIQYCILDACKAYLEIKHEVEWKETNKLLRAEIYPKINTDTVNCNIQFGNFKRSTNDISAIEKAQEEICAHRYVDLSESHAGFALLNDCKYGHRVKNNRLFLTLLRSPQYPGEDADKGYHLHSYALYPHKGSFENSDVVEKSYEFNIPPSLMNAPLPFDFSGDDNIIIETIKKAENDNAVILRVYECKGKTGRAIIKPQFKCKNKYETTLDEKDIALLNGDEFQLSPFEIKTIKFKI